MTITPITSFTEFYDIINRDQLVFVDFWAEWCGPCKVIKPIYEDLSNHHNDASYYTVDIGKHDDIAQEVRVTNVPVVMAFKNGNVLGTNVGSDRDRLVAFVEKHAQ